MTASSTLAPPSFIPERSPTDTVEAIRRDAERRLQELAPFLEEAEKLRGILGAIDGSPAPAPAPAAARAAASTRRSARVTPNGANKREILRVVGEQPGITPREIAARTGIKRTVVASTVNRLKRRGEVDEHPETGARGGVALPGAVRG